MKKKILLLSLLVLALSVGTVGTLAFRTSEKDTHNVITTGNVKIAVLETLGDESPYPSEPQKVMPSNEMPKVVRIENTGSSDAWVRVKVDIKFEDENGRPLSGKSGDNPLAFITPNQGWSYKDGYYYYDSPLTPGSISDSLFDKVTFSEKMGNDYQGASIKVIVSAHGVQSKNNGTSVAEAKGWPAEAVTE